MLVIPEYVLKGGPWSISKAGVIEKCSLQFDFKYGPTKIPEVVKYEESRVGVAVHKALELVLGGAEQKLSFLMASDESELTTTELDQLMSFWDQVARFKKKMDTFKQKYGVKETFIERKWGVRTDFSGCHFYDQNVFFRGVVDYALLCAGGHLVILDHKSGKERDISYYDKQFKAYAIMALAMYPDLKGIQTAINFIQTDTMPWNAYVSAARIRDEYVPWMVKYLTDACKGLLEAPKAATGWWCSWCGFKPVCPAHGGSGRVDQAA